MQYRSDKFLRQDLLFPCLFDGITRQCVSAELNSLDLLFKNRNIDKEAVKVQLMLYRLKRKYNISSNKAKEILLEFITIKVNSHCKKYIASQKHLARILKGAFDEINSVIIKNKLTPDKIILIALKMVEIANEKGIYLPEFTEGIFNVFLEIEYLHNIDLNQDDFERLKSSADKQAIKIFRKFQEKGYFLKKTS